MVIEVTRESYCSMSSGEVTSQMAFGTGIGLGARQHQTLIETSYWTTEREERLITEVVCSEVIPDKGRYISRRR